MKLEGSLVPWRLSHIFLSSYLTLPALSPLAVTVTVVRFASQFPQILPRCVSPLTVYNSVTYELFVGLKNRTSRDSDLVNSLVHIYIALKRSAKARHLEAIELENRSEVLSKMIDTCMTSSGMNSESNVSSVFREKGLRAHSLTYRNPLVRDAESFVSGTLSHSIKEDVYAVVGSTQVMDNASDCSLSRPVT